MLFEDAEPAEGRAAEEDVMPVIDWGTESERIGEEDIDTEREDGDKDDGRDDDEGEDEGGDEGEDASGDEGEDGDRGEDGDEGEDGDGGEGEEVDSPSLQYVVRSRLVS